MRDVEIELPNHVANGWGRERLSTDVQDVPYRCVNVGGCLGADNLGQGGPVGSRGEGAMGRVGRIDRGHRFLIRLW